MPDLTIVSGMREAGLATALRLADLLEDGRGGAQDRAFIRAELLQSLRQPRLAAAPHPVHHRAAFGDRKSTRLNSSHLGISYAVFCLKKKKHNHSSAPGQCVETLLHRTTGA